MAPFESLDFLYTPSRDVASDLTDLVETLGARVVFAIDDGGIRAAMLELTEGPPNILLTDHVDGERPIMVFRVADHRATVDQLRSGGWTSLGHSRSRRARAPRSGRRAACGSRSTSSIRPQVLEHFAGRRDF